MKVVITSNRSSRRAHYFIGKKSRLFWLGPLFVGLYRR